MSQSKTSDISTASIPDISGVTASKPSAAAADVQSPKASDTVRPAAPKTTDRSATSDTADSASADAEQVRIRKDKRERLLSEGIQPYPVELPITSTIKDIREKYAHLVTGEETQDEVGIAGRVMLMRNGGKLCFATLQDGAGNRIQIMLSAKEVGTESLAAYKADVDLGDHLFVHGRVISSRRGELSIMAEPGSIDEAPAASGDSAQSVPGNASAVDAQTENSIASEPSVGAVVQTSSVHEASAASGDSAQPVSGNASAAGVQPESSTASEPSVGAVVQTSSVHEAPAASGDSAQSVPGNASAADPILNLSQATSDAAQAGVDATGVVSAAPAAVPSASADTPAAAQPNADATELAADANTTNAAVPSWRIASKALRPLPKTYTAEDGTEMSLSEDMRIRRRYLDMITRPAARDMVRLRANVVKSLRSYFDQAGFVEIETPMLQTLHGGAAARPFQTHMNAYDTDLYLRIAPELYLKRAVVGGVDKVFEINRNFRNEGADSSHSPEFTMLEAYEAYGNYNTMAVRTREFIQQAAREALGTEQVTLPDGTIYDLSGEWASIDLYGATSEAVGQRLTPQTPRKELVRIAEGLGEDIPDHYVPGKIVEVIFEKTVGDSLYAPTFVRDFPADSSPLVRNHRSKPGQVEKWDLYVRGFELATAYSELVDPVIQRKRFEEQALAAANGDPEAMQLDEDFLMAMEYAMPPTGGMGMGLDRLLMALTGQGIRETITFPLVKKL